MMRRHLRDDMPAPWQVRQMPGGLISVGGRRHDEHHRVIVNSRRDFGQTQPMATPAPSAEALARQYLLAPLSVPGQDCGAMEITDRPPMRFDLPGKIPST